MSATTIPLKRLARLVYGDALAAEVRVEGEVPVIGSGGASGFHNMANALGPTIVIGRKGSYGTIYWQPRDCFVIDTAYYVKPVVSDIDLRWLYYALQAVDLKGVSQDVGVPGLSREDAHEVRVPVTRLEEQRGIADFLDAETARIDGLQSTRDRQFAAIDELVASRVSALVPSQTDVPFVRLGYLSVIQSGITVDANRDPGSDSVTVPYLRVANVQDGHLDLGSITEITVPRVAVRSSTLRCGDVLMTEGGDLDKLGRGTVWNAEIENCLHQNHVFAVRPNQTKLSPDYLALMTRTAYARAYFESTGTKTTNLASTSSSKIRDFKIPLIDLRAQARIVHETTAWLADISRVQAALTLQRTLVAERRQALITAAVTGGITL